MRNLFALLGALLLAGGAAHAQDGYSAPGFPMLPHRRPAPPADPTAPKLLSPVLARFWHAPAACRVASGSCQKRASTGESNLG
ncbi:MAG: hypothetical protein EOO62_03715, partial [Hymenobacter sp.]